ncbi:unc-112-related protein-like [Oscarella lobularis]|uniref:unc-112-related protein-like n=1 Tax=Oscarella lobularis TaxID=121494 RepID=UPI003313C178
MSLEWGLQVFVTSNQVKKTIRVSGEMIIGEVILELVSSLTSEQDWSDHALWWPEKKQWLLGARITLNAYGVQSDARLHFTPQRKYLSVQLPDRRYRKVKCSFSVLTFHAVAELCEQLCIRHPEEMSLVKARPRRKKDSDSRNGSPDPAAAAVDDDYPDGIFGDTLARSTEDRAAMNARWVDSSISLAEQGVEEFDPVQLKFKYHAFMNIDPKIDQDRIDQLYAQAKWSVLFEDVDCTEEEAIAFAALQMQVKLAVEMPVTRRSDFKEAASVEDQLNELQLGQRLPPRNRGLPTTSSKKLSAMLKFHKPGRFDTLGKRFKKYWFVFQDMHVSYYKCQEDEGGAPVGKTKLDKGTDVTPEINVTKKKFIIRIEVQTLDSSDVFELKCDNEDQYAEWMTACQLASKGRTLDDPNYEAELASVKAFVHLQVGKGSVSDAHDSAGSAQMGELTPSDFVSQRILKKLKPQKIAELIRKQHSKVNQLPTMEAKLKYIRDWEALADYGISYFIVRFSGSRKQELLGITYNRIIRMDINTHEHKKTWRYSAMRAWNINWEIKEMRIEHEDNSFSFSCQSADLKVVHEYIGGYIFLSMRESDEDELDVEMFLKLTGGWHESTDPTVLPSAS